MRGDIQRKTEEFLSRGGEIKKHERGETGEPADKPRAKSVFVSSQPRQTRTYINDVVSALDNRKKAARPTPKPVAKPAKRARKKVIYDDFGDPLREVWTDGRDVVPEPGQEKEQVQDKDKKKD